MRPRLARGGAAAAHRRTAPPVAVDADPTADPDVEPHGEVRLRPLVVALFIVSLLGALNMTIVAASLATIAGDLGGVEHMVWTISSFALGSTVALPVFGQLADIRGHRPIFLRSLAIFLVGSVLCGVSMSMLQLTLARLVQGVGGAGLGLLSQTILAEVVPPRQRPRYMALIGSVFAVATVAGPVLGGVLTDTVGWRAVFFFSVPFGLVALLVALRAIPHLAPKRPDAPLDVQGAVLLGVGLSAFVIALSLGGGSIAWDSAWMLLISVVGITAIAGFGVAERRARVPLVPFVMFRDRVVLGSTALLVVVGVGIFSVVAFLPAFIQMRYAVSAAIAGAVDIAIVAGLLVTSNATAWLIGRSGRYRLYPIAGTALGAGALATLAITVGDAPLWVVAVVFLLIGAGAGAFMQLALVLVQNQAPSQYLGVATSSANLLRQIAVTIASAIMGGVFGSSVVRQLDDLELPGGIAPNELTPQIVRASSSAFQRQVADAYTAAMTPVIVALAVVFGAGLVVALVLPVVDLDDGSRDGQ